MLRTTLAGLRLHKSRYVTTVLAILLGVMFISGTMVFADTLKASYEESVMGSATGVDAIATPAEPEYVEGEDPAEAVAFDEEQLERVRDLPEVASADGMLEGRAVLLDAEGRAVGFMPPAAVSLGDASRFSAKEGRLPEADDEIALATSTASSTGFEVGDTVTMLDADQEKRDFTLTGLVNFGVDPNFSMAGATVLTENVVREIAAPQGYSEIDVVAAEGTDDETVAKAVEEELGATAEVATGTEFGEELAEGVGAQTEVLRIALLLFGVIAMFVAAIVIYNTFAILIAQRQRELALLRCVGAKRGQVFRSVLTESFVVGMVSSILGVLAGIGIGMAGARFAGPLMGTDVTASVVIGPGAVLSGLLLGTLMTVFSALVPAMRATRVAPLAALRTSATASGLEKGTGWVRVVFGLLLFAVSAGLIGLTRMTGPDPAGLFIVTGAALIAFVGVVVLGPLLVRGIVRLVGVPLRRVGVPSMLAVDNSVRNPRRAATAMIALTVGATLITGYSVVSASLESTLTKTLDEQFPVDYQISPQFNPDELTVGQEETETTEEGVEGPVEGTEEGAAEGTEVAVEDEEPLAELATIPSRVREDLEKESTVSKVFGVRSDSAEVAEEGVGGPLESMPVSTYVGADMGTDLTADMVEGELSDLEPGRVVLSEGYAGGMGVGDTLTLVTPEGDLELEIAAIAEDMQSLFGATVSEEDFVRAFPERTQDDTLMIRGAEGADSAELREAVYSAVDDHPTLQVDSVAEMKNQFSQMMDIAFYTIAAMLGLAIIIAVFGISNTMALSVLERTRESALLRALGLARGQLRRMLSIEAVLLCLIGAGIGIALGVVFGWAAAAAVLPNMVFAAPAGQIAVFIAVSVLAGLLAAVLPARRAAGTSITGALASE
ncbi:ABC transporter permease [Nocardiopsis sp. LDBS1602]|uniref:ABC transporter permease n=1 Tax=Nocardiopsis sp. LDBS1602 TaxID=3109597 RepID=UPI002DB77643|nr:FtsX-like permease family protein [Nocardiopsis sp. LDBS1602]MEC3895739.1 FtsX-like permease family protein [Nocardiopsis sp. LDBS1602]